MKDNFYLWHSSFTSGSITGWLQIFGMFIFALALLIFCSFFVIHNNYICFLGTAASASFIPGASNPRAACGPLKLSKWPVKLSTLVS